MDTSRIPFEPTRYEGISLHIYRRDEETGNGAAIIRMEPGCGYPRHRHHGTEELLVIQGGYRDHLGEYRAGEYVCYEDGSEHHPIALEGDEACILFAVSGRGIELLDPKPE